MEIVGIELVIPINCRAHRARVGSSLLSADTEHGGAADSSAAEDEAGIGIASATDDVVGLPAIEIRHPATPS